MSLRPSFFAFPLLGVVAFACGGSVESSTQRTGDPTSPGSRSSGDSGGSGNSGGTAGTGSPRPEPCEGTPYCNPGYTEVAFCSVGPSCMEMHVCSYSYYCLADTSQCNVYPECNAGDTQVATKSQCIQDDAACYSRTTCGVTIWCTGTPAADAGTPDAAPPPPPANP